MSPVPHPTSSLPLAQVVRATRELDAAADAATEAARRLARTHRADAARLAHVTQSMLRSAGRRTSGTASRTALR